MYKNVWKCFDKNLKKILAEREAGKRHKFL
jgi:hypothetical protein